MRVAVIDLTDPTALAILAAKAFEQSGVEYALYGGLVLAAYGEARETRDADLAVVGDVVDVARVALERAGVTTHVAFVDVVFGGLSLTRITVIGGTETTGLNTLDLVRPRSARFARGVMDRSVAAPLRDATIRIVTAEDFVLLKALSTRERDLDDAATVVRRLGDLFDSAVVDPEVELLDQEVPEAQVPARMAAILARARD